MQIKKGDNVKIISGKDKGKSGKVVNVNKEKGLIMIEGVAIKKKHSKPKKAGQKGQIIESPSFIKASAAQVICPSCNKPARIGHKTQGEKKFRSCKKCGGNL